MRASKIEGNPHSQGSMQSCLLACKGNCKCHITYNSDTDRVKTEVVDPSLRGSDWIAYCFRSFSVASPLWEAADEEQAEMGNAKAFPLFCKAK